MYVLNSNNLCFSGLAFDECVAGRCGAEAACSRIPNDTRYTCICPHDKSAPTRDLRCPVRRTVPLTPRPIYNIIPPSGGNSTGSGNITTPQQTEPRTTEGRPAQLPDSLFIGFCVATSIIIAVSFTICLWKRKEIHKFISKSGKHRKPSCTPCPLSLSKGLLVPDRYTSNPQYTPCLSSNSSAVPVPLLPRDTLCFLQEIGEGCFGKVYKGELQRDDGQPADVVAVKVLKESATREAEEDFMREVDIMSAFRHVNILSLIGVVLRDAGSSPWMVFEFMPHGDLAEVLRRNSRQLWKPVPGLAPLTKESLLSVALQIAAGMRYLAAQRFVHRDLACRNCLVGVDLSVKIADFGMSRDVYTCDYYKIGGSRLLPVRWMSPESVMYGRFTLESDVWSYGVVLWEIYSLGKQPYYGHSNEEVVKLILQDIMLIPPEDCPPIICDLMRSCWKTEPRDRIRFPDIHERLQKAWERNALTPPRRQPTLSTFRPSPMPLPRPPGAFPVAQFKSVELLDTENYLLPQIPPASRCEYLQPLPD